jgi:hypothetical protein
LAADGEDSFVESPVSANGDPVVEDEVMAEERNDGNDSEDTAAEATIVELAPIDPDTDMESEESDEGADDLNVENTLADHAIPDVSSSDLTSSDLANPDVASAKFLDPIATLVDAPHPPDVTLVDRAAAPEADDDAEVERTEPTDVGGFVGEDTSISEEPVSSNDEETS